MYDLKQNTAINVLFYCHDAAGDPVTGLTNGSFTAKRISKNGGAFADLSATVTERERGWYLLALASGDSDTLGVMTILLTAAAIKQVNLQFRVVTHLAEDLSPRIPAALISGKMDVNVSYWGGSAIAAPNVAGVPQVDLSHIDGLATNSPLASLNLKRLVIANTDTTAAVSIQNTNVSAGPAISVASTAGAGCSLSGQTNALSLAALGSAAALRIAGNTGPGMQVLTTSGIGLQVLGGGANAGVQIVAGVTGRGLEVKGGASSGDAAFFQAQASGHGIRIDGFGAGHGLFATGGATSGDGFRAVGGGTGVDINADLFGTINGFTTAAKAEIEAEANDALVALKLNLLLAAATTLSSDVHLDSVVGQMLDAGTSWSYDRTADSLEVVSTITGSTPNDIADAVWSTALPGSYNAGEAGYILGTNLDVVLSTRATPAQILATPANLLETDADGAVLIQAGTGTGQLDFASGVVKSDLTQIDGQTTADNNAVLNLKQLKIVNTISGQAALHLETTVGSRGAAYLSAPSGAPGSLEILGGIYGVRVQGQNGVLIEGTTGLGLDVNGWFSTGMRVRGGTFGNGYGLQISGNGSGGGVDIAGGNVSALLIRNASSCPMPALWVRGSSNTAQPAVKFEGLYAAGNGIGLQIVGAGTGYGMEVIGGTSAAAIRAKSTSGSVDILGNIQGNLIGTIDGLSATAQQHVAQSVLLSPSEKLYTAVGGNVRADIVAIAGDDTVPETVRHFYAGGARVCHITGGSTTQVQTDLTEADDHWYKAGFVILDGPNAAVTRRVNAYAQVNGTVSVEALPNTPTPGSTAIVWGRIQ